MISINEALKHISNSLKTMEHESLKISEIPADNQYPDSLPSGKDG